MAVKRLYTLGDSFMSVDDPCKGIVSFLELYAERKGFQHISLGRPGATNFAIRLQIDRAIEEKADYIVVGATHPDRIDVPISPDPLCDYQLDNILYTGYKAASEKHVANGQPVRLVSDTFSDLMINERTGLNDNQLDAIKNYITYLHCYSLQKQKDCYIISDGLHKLEKSGIPFLFLQGGLMFDWSDVKRIWPLEIPQPWTCPYGNYKFEVDKPVTATHNPQIAHDEFCETLMSITSDWH